MRKHTIASAAFLMLLAHLTSTGAIAQQGNPQPVRQASRSDVEAVVAQLAMEIRVVRLELQMLRLDYSARIVTALEQEAQSLQAQRRKVETREAAIRESVASLIELLKQPALSSGEREELEAIRKSRDLSPESELARILAEKDTLVRREAQLAQQIDIERRKWEQARATAEGLQNELSRMQRPAAEQAR